MAELPTSVDVENAVQDIVAVGMTVAYVGQRDSEKFADTLRRAQHNATLAAERQRVMGMTGEAYAPTEEERVSDQKKCPIPCPDGEACPDARRYGKVHPAPTPPEGPKGETYPCEKCGKRRTKAEGGTTFTVCDECWDSPSPDAAQRVETEWAHLERRLSRGMKEDVPWARAQLESFAAALTARAEAPLRERVKALEAKLAAFIANVDEMHVGVGLPEMFTVMHEGKTYAVQPEVPEAWYKAIRDKWNKDSANLIASWNEMDLARIRAESALAALSSRHGKLKEAADELARCEAAYRDCCEHYGGGARSTGYAWDQMRKAGDKVRALLEETTG